MFLSAPFVILFFILEQFARAIGAPMISMIGMLASVGLNIILDPILIFGFDLNVVGAALGTAISNVAAALFFIVYFMKIVTLCQLILNLRNLIKKCFLKSLKSVFLHFNEYLNGIHRISFKFIFSTLWKLRDCKLWYLI